MQPVVMWIDGPRGPVYGAEAIVTADGVIAVGRWSFRLETEAAETEAADWAARLATMTGRRTAMARFAGRRRPTWAMWDAGAPVGVLPVGFPFGPRPGDPIGESRSLAWRLYRRLLPILLERAGDAAPARLADAIGRHADYHGVWPAIEAGRAVLDNDVEGRRIWDFGPADDAFYGVVGATADRRDAFRARRMRLASWE